MKHQNKMRNKLIACVMCVVMVGAILFGTPWFSVLADNTTTTGQSYASWENQLVTNGTFEAGYEGKEVYGWHKTAMNNGYGKETTNISSYLEAYTLTTAVENGNKVAALAKTGSGYVAATSEKVSVVGGKDYILSFDYKTKNAEIVKEDGSLETDYKGIRLQVEELDSDGNVIKDITSRTEGTDFYEDTAINYNWSTGMVQFKTQPETAYVVLYFRAGHTYKVNATVLLDNVVLEANDEYKVFNGTFDQVTLKSGIDAVREEGDKGPLGWTKKNAVEVFKPTVEVDDTRGNVMCVSLVSTATANKTVEIASPLIPVKPNATCHMTADYKLVMETKDGTDITLKNPTRISLTFCNVSGKPLSSGTKRADLSKTAVSDWTKASYRTTATAQTTNDIQYVRVGAYAQLTAEEMANLRSFKLYIDNVTLDVNDDSLGYTKVSTKNEGQFNGITADYTDHYAIRKVNGGVGYEDAIQLYVARQDGITGGVTFYTKPMLVNPVTKYGIEFDYKIEEVESTSFYGADVVIRFLDSDDKYISNGKDSYEDGEATELRFTNSSYNAVNTDGWQHWSRRTFTTPAGAAKMQIGFVIGGDTENINPNLKQSFANVSIGLDAAHWNEYEEGKKTDLLFKLTELGNVYSDDTEIDILDLVMMKRYAANATLITEDVLKNADMNVNTLINNADIELLHWKLLGVSTETEAASVQGYNFYQ